jgi:hypothetical protein
MFGHAAAFGNTSGMDTDDCDAADAGAAARVAAKTAITVYIECHPNGSSTPTSM